jgi:hypothetical protein
MVAFANVTPLPVLVSERDAPLQVVAGAVPVTTLRLAGKVSASVDCVSANGLVLIRVRVNVALAPAATLTGENTGATVGGLAVNVMGAGQAVALLPAAVGADVVAPDAVNSTIAVSVWPAESVTVSCSLPALPFQITCTPAPPAADSSVTPPVALQA